MSQPTVAVIGASTDREKYGNKSVRAHQRNGFTVYPINPKATEIEGIKAYASLGDLPDVALTRISMYVPPAVGLKLLPEVAAKGCEELWLNPGAESDELIKQAEALGLNVIIACSIVDVGENPSQLN